MSWAVKRPAPMSLLILEQVGHMLRLCSDIECLAAPFHATDIVNDGSRELTNDRTREFAMPANLKS